MNGNVIFISGVYGVGKSTICKKISSFLNIPAFSSGDLISEKNGEKYGPNKLVKDKNYNQQLLIGAINEKIINTPNILLAGHFCILNSNYDVEILPEFVFRKIHISKIILLETAAEVIINHLRYRDNKNYSLNEIMKLIEAENLQANKIAKDLNVPIIVHKMKYDDSDISQLLSVIQKKVTNQ